MRAQLQLASARAPTGSRQPEPTAKQIERPLEEVTRLIRRNETIANKPTTTKSPHTTTTPQHSNVQTALSQPTLLALVCILLIVGSAAQRRPASQSQSQAQPHSLFLFAGEPSGGRKSASSRLQTGAPSQEPQGLLVCPEGWQKHSNQCYRFFQQRHSWGRARQICEHYGAQLALILDYQQNNFTSHLAAASLLGSAGHADFAKDSAPVYASDQRSYWIGFRAIDGLATNTLESAANTFVSKYVGFWDLEEPRVSQGECVRTTVHRESLGLSAGHSAAYRLLSQAGGASSAGPQQVWQLAQCEDLLPFVCQRQVCSSNSFHCSNGRCINGAWKCDGHNDCGDHSDEMDCPRRCHYYMSSSGDKVQSVNYPQRYEPSSDCKWTLEGPLEAGMMLQFYEFDTEKHFDQVQVLTGARTEERAFTLATLSGQLNLTQRPFVSGSNLMIVKFKSDAHTERRGFRASWKTEAIECGGELFAHNSAQLITSPLYPDQYPGGIECVYRLLAPSGKVISLELLELDLAEERGDQLLVRDGQQAADPLLASLTGSMEANEQHRFISSTGNRLYLYFKTDFSTYAEQRRGFAIRFRTGCDINHVASNGTLRSPAYQVSRYPANQQCVYRLSRPDASSPAGGALSLRLDELELGPDEQLVAYDGHELATAQRLNMKRLAAKSVVSAASGRLMLVLSSAPLASAGLAANQPASTTSQSQSQPQRRFSASYSADCPPLKLGKGVLLVQGQAQAQQSARFGTQLTYACPRGQEFSNGQLRLQNECLMGGRWSLARVPNCQERYCGPVPQIDNGFAVNATGVTYNQTATYRCYNGFQLASGRHMDTITCLENGSWGRLPECHSTSCPPLREVPNSKQLLLAGSLASRQYGTVIRFECEPGYQRQGIPSLLCTSSGSWSSQAPDCVRAQCKQVPQIEHGALHEPNGLQQPFPASRKFYFMDEARVHCERGYKLDSAPGSANGNTPSNSLIKCGTNGTFEAVPRCVDIDECQIVSTCDLASSVCRNSQGGYHCECKSGFAPNLECRQSQDLGLSSGQLPDSAIQVSSTAANFDSSNIRLNRAGWCAAPGQQDNWVRIDLRTVSIIKGFRIQPVALVSNEQPQQAFPSLLRLRYSNNLTDSFRDYQDSSRRAVQFRLNNLNTAGTFNVQLPLPIEARYLDLVLVDYQNAPCMRLELVGCVRHACQDINECQKDNGGCSHRCLNSPGSYQCACDRGFDLFTHNGLHSFQVAPQETGLRDGDLYRLNKTCVPKQCPPLGEPVNGQLLSAQFRRQLYHFGDVARFNCRFGYILSGSAALSCQANGQWNGTVPECQQAKCKPLSNDRAQGLVARFETGAGELLAAAGADATIADATTTSDGQLPFLSNMTVYCKEQGRSLRATASASFRQCVYNIRNDTGRADYWFSGAPPACPRVDCGVPPPTPGAFAYQYSDTKFGSSFFFGCEESYNLAGQSQAGNNFVSCRADGTWDFGDLRCEGHVCQDPGRAADGEQIASSYEPGSQVNFKCRRPGYAPYSSEPLTCTRGAECRVIKTLGLASGLIPDKWINASSYRDNYEPAKARLGSSTGWCSKSTEMMPYVTVDLGRPHRIKAILIRGVVTVDVVGRPLEVRVFYKKLGQPDISLVYPNFNLSTPMDLLQQQLGLANYGELSMIQLPSQIVAQVVGVNIIRSIRNPCLQIEVLGCELDQQQTTAGSQTSLLGYEQPAPVCVDQEPPQFNWCPEQPIPVQRGPYGELLPLNFTVPQATDNSGLVARVEVRPKGFRPGQYVFADKQVHYVALDKDGNLAICTVNITVPDITAPKLSCPPSYTHYLELPPLQGQLNAPELMQSEQSPSSQVFDYAALMRDKIRASDDSGAVFLELAPASSTIQVNSFENVTVYARDKYNNTAQCSFQVRLLAPTCSKHSLQAPANGQLECLPPANGQPQSPIQCVATCNEGFRFLDGRRSHSYLCDPSASRPPQVEDCVLSQWEESAYTVAATINYKLAWLQQQQPTSPLNSQTLNSCLANYTELVNQYVRDLQELLSTRCTVLNGNTQVEFRNIRAQLKQIVRDKQEELVAIQYEMRVYSKVKKGPIFVLCGQTIRQSFDLRLPASNSIAPLLNLTLLANPSNPESELNQNCPALIGSSSSTSAGYRCASGFILTNQTSAAAGPSSSADSSSGDSSSDESGAAGREASGDDSGLPVEIMEVPVCVQCPAGNFVQESARNQCKPCPRGFYQDKPAQAECVPCPELSSSLVEGAKSSQECQPICAYGSFSETGLAPCNQCPINTYSGAPLNANRGHTECLRCPAHRPYTYGAGSYQASDCRAKCAPGSYSDTGLEPCAPCPQNFYQEQEGANRCLECAMANRTLRAGSAFEQQCVPSSCAATLNPNTGGPCLADSDEAQAGKCFPGCQQNGVCTIQLHEPQCHCPSGFKGKFCEIEINECANEPCHNGATCVDLKQGYRCKCAPGYTGLQCQLEKADCQPDSCPKRSMCQDLPGPGNFTCLCRSGYTGAQCNVTLDPCLQSPCSNGASCVALAQGRFKCSCPPGWTGTRCDINVDDCAEEPCLLGAKCTDLVNDYRCECPAGFTGKRCHEKLDLCASQPCGPNGVCLDRLFDFRCICAQGWRGDTCNQTDDACSTLESPCSGRGECINLQPTPQLQIGASSELNTTATSASAPALLVEDSFKCICEPRYTGSRCQHEVDSCELNKCENGGTCVDTADGFECKCKPGFVGLNCEAQVKECLGEPCASPGTLECQDLINSHRCVCAPGYTGPRCEQEVNECLQEPCQNGATCQDRINDYQCQCPSGWTGKNCDIDVGACHTEPCLNSAKCVDLFEDYFCACASGTDGKRCQTSPQRCVGNPCQNGGHCHDFGSGLNCSCPAGWTGAGCEHLLEPCLAGLCKNGATCLDSADLPGGYECRCAAGWQGRHCDEDVTDCRPHSCPANAQCVELTNGFQCRCPAGLAGDDCRKPLTYDYDLHFNQLAKSSSASQVLPFEVANLSEFTIAVWVQYTEASSAPELVVQAPLSTQQSEARKSSKSQQQQLQSRSGRFLHSAGSGSPTSQPPVAATSASGASSEEQASGAYLSMYSSELAHQATSGRRRELLKFDQTGVTVTLFAHQKPEFLPYLVNVPINDGQWHYVNLVWSSETGNVTLVTDSAVAATRSNYGHKQTIRDAAYAYLNLGAELRAGSQLPLAGSGFYGRLSRAFVWSKALDVGSELAKQFGSCKGAQLARPEALLSTWSGFEQLTGSVEREQPSQCGQRVCPVGLAGDECAILQQDKQPPKVLLCPHDMWVITNNASTVVEWDEPHFIDDLAKPVAVAEQNNLKPGSLLGHGLYDLSYIAVDESGNTARCDFQIRVLRDFCPLPLEPINGRAHCKSWGPSGNFKTCSIECKEGFEFSQPVSQHYVCGAEGFWRPTGEPQRELVFPACTAKHSAQRIYRMSINFPSAAVCSESGKRILNARIHENLLRIDQAWRLCSQSSGEERGRCDNLRVNVKCTKQLVSTSGASSSLHSASGGPQASSGRWRRWAPPTGAAGGGSSSLDQRQQQQQQQDSDVYVVEVSFPANADPIASSANNKLKRNITDILRDAIVKESILDVHQTLPNVQPDMSSLELENEYACEPGKVVVGSNCVECAPGTYYEERARACLECPLSYYQDDTKATQCKPCPSINGRLGVTSSPGSRSVDQCKERCLPGHYFDESAQLCRHCGHGHYQPGEGSFACLACGPGLTTRSTEAVSRHECRPECEQGQQLNQLGNCEPCPMGSYRGRGRPACEPCPAGFTTETLGSTERRHCSLALCPAGHYLNATVDRCAECPRGFYQPQQQRDTSCLSCPQDTTTDSEAATSLDNCTNPCLVNGQAQMCQPNSYCVFAKDTQNFTCECKPKYRMDDQEQCVYVCDDYCLNGATCSANNDQNRPRCDCPASFYGERCERKSEFIYIASGIAIGLALILFIIIIIWMICVRTSASSSSSSSMSHIAPSTKQALQASMHASQLDFANMAAAAAAATLPGSLAGHPNPAAAFYYGAGGQYAESVAPSHQSAAYAHYYDDDEDDEAAAGDMWDMPNFYNETYLKDSLHHGGTPLVVGAHHNNNNNIKASKQNIYSNALSAADHQLLMNNAAAEAAQHQQHPMAMEKSMDAANNNNNKDELYDRLKRHLYTGQKGDTTDSGEEAH